MIDYGKVEDLIYKGFLTSTLDMGGTPLVLKSVNANEFDLLSLQSFSYPESWTIYTSYLLAYSTFYFNRVNTLVDRPHIINELADIYAGLPEYLLHYLLAIVTRLNRVAYDTVTVVENYCCGEKSRQHWGMLKGQDFHKASGISGADHLGLNTHQRLWVFYNREEDKNDGFLQQYSLAKFIVGPHAPKEIQRINSLDTERVKTRERKRRARHMGTLFLDEAHEVRIIDESPEELLDQFERSLHGQKDWHDIVIENHQKQIQEAYRRRAEEDARKRQEAKQDAQSVESLLDDDGYSLEEIQHMQREMSERRLKDLEETHESTLSVEERERSLLKWGFIKADDIPTNRRAYYSDVASVKNSPIKDE